MEPAGPSAAASFVLHMSGLCPLAPHRPELSSPRFPQGPKAPSCGSCMDLGPSSLDSSCTLPPPCCGFAPASPCPTPPMNLGSHRSGPQSSPLAQGPPAPGILHSLPLCITQPTVPSYPTVSTPSGIPIPSAPHRPFISRSHSPILLLRLTRNCSPNSQPMWGPSAQTPQLCAFDHAGHQGCQGGQRGSAGLSPSTPNHTVSGACFPLPAVCSSDSGSESKSGRLWSCCWKRATWGAARAVGLCGTPLWVQGTSRDKLGEEKLFKGCYVRTRLVGNWWGSTVGSAHVSPCQHLLSVPDGDVQQGWSTRGPAQHP